MSVYPSALPTLRVVENDPGVAYDPSQKNVVFAEDINNIAAEIMAIARELGTEPKGAYDDVKTRLVDLSYRINSAQTIASGKAERKVNALREITTYGLKSDWTQTATVQNTAYTVKAGTQPTDLVASFSLQVPTKTIGAIIEFECFMQTDNVNWVECAIFDGDTPLSGWMRLNASGTVITYSKVRTYGNLAAGQHAIKVKIRKTHATATKFRVIDPSIYVLEMRDD